MTGPTTSPWSTKVGRDAIAGFLRGDVSRSALIRDVGAANWELVILSRSRRALTRKGRRRLGGLAAARHARGLARTLVAVRENKLHGTNLQARLLDSGFQGNRRDLQRILESTRSPLGDEEWRSWRRRSRGRIDLRGADLSGLRLSGYDLRGADLRGANLSAAVMRTCVLTDADLRYAQMRHTDLSYATLTGVRLKGAVLAESMLTGTNLRKATLGGAYLLGAMLNRAELEGTILRGAIVWGVTSWGCTFNEATDQADLRVAPEFHLDDQDPESLLRPGATVSVDGLEVAHFVSLLFQSPLGDLINAAADKIVLLLGRFTDETRDVLDALRAALPKYGYAPVVFDFAEPKNRDTIETVAVLAGLSSFVIANLSQPRSTPLETQLVVPTIAVPFVPIVRAGEDPFAMFGALQRKYRWVLPTVRYRTAAGLVSRLDRDVIQPARRAANQIRRLKHPTADH